ncbi:Crp/Fnr family transcriptional regulator [Yoonia litorea]|uniref:Cyclic nucleotide-binding domain-containing protein n=1 Tax=Yoonia litorea TaxID=1123755 RepID=A0A1I6MI03_9RHOB|nr:cyclic nucleotide-binding domain-containing protein [Yoonia litorea]SFS15241.1 Cyclic nucleotide-binding domain-containing protein [Yoonia litorea]
MMAYVEIAGWLGTLLTFTAYSMRNMLPLRIIALAANLAFMTYGALVPVYPMLVLHLGLFPLNAFRLYEIQRGMRRMKEVRSGKQPLDVLTPFLKTKAYKKGDTIFSQGDKPDKVYLLETGAISLPEVNVRLEGPSLFGEMAYFTNAAERTTSAVCASDCTIAAVDGKTFMGLYRQHPEFGHYVIALIASRLITSDPARRAAYEGFVVKAE